MSEDRRLDFEQGLALQLYMKHQFDSRMGIVLPTPPPEEMVQDDNGNYYLREDGTFGDFYMDQAAVPARENRIQPRNTWGARQPRGAATINEDAVEEPPPPPPPERVRYRCLQSYNQRMMKHCKQEARELLEILFT